MAGLLPESGDAGAAFINAGRGEEARRCDAQVLADGAERAGPALPELIGGSADLTGSNLTFWKGSKRDHRGRPTATTFYGVREFGMSAIMNGMALHGGFIPYGGTFLTFSDYARNAVRMAALMKLRVIFVYTHDSIGLGEDGPTHQAGGARAEPAPDPEPRRLAALRRGRDRGRLARGALSAATAQRLLLTRQGLPQQARDAGQLADIARGGYVLRMRRHAGAADHRHRLGGAAGGGAAELWPPTGAACAWSRCRTTEVSMPGRGLPRAHRCCPRGAPRVAIEAGVTDGWWRYVGPRGRIVGLDRFGESAPAGRRCSSTSASPWTTWPRPCRRERLAGEANAGLTKSEENGHDHQGCINGYGRIGRNILRALYEGAHAARSRSSRSTTSAMPRPMPT
jgi:transketolase